MNQITSLRQDGPESLRESVTAEEWTARVDLAAAYRLCELYGLSDMIYTHISARIPGEPDAFLLNPHGMFFNEITASSLLKVDMEGRVITQTDERYGLHVAGFVIHSAIYRARPDVYAAMHTHTVAGMAVSSLKCGLIPITQTSHRFIDHLAYHDFNGPERDPEERDALAADLGDKSCAILRNHGLLTVGPTMAEAFNYMYGLNRSCEAQLAAMSCNTELNVLSDAVVEKSKSMYAPGAIRRYGLLEWLGLLRKLDRLDTSFRQ